MISGREAVLALSGAMRLARFDAKGTYFFNATLAGFWNSFWAAAVILPLQALEMALLWELRGTTDTLPVFLGIGLSSNAVSWLGFLLAMVYIARISGREHRYLAYAIANNWTGMLIVVLSVPVEIAQLTGVLTGDLLAFALAVTYLYRFVLPWFVARHALNLSVLAAIGVVALDVLISGIIAIITYPAMFGS